MTVRGTESRREPRDTFLNVRFERSTHRQLAALARRNDRTLAAEIRVAVRDHLERSRDEKEKT